MPSPEKCDDCGKFYAGDTYYSVENCVVYKDDIEVPHNCTGSICPSCAGPFLEPDTANDPRRPAIDFFDPRLFPTDVGRLAAGNILLPLVPPTKEVTA